MYTLQNVKDIYDTEACLGYTNLSFEEFLREYFVQTYDEHLNFLGLETK